MEGKHLAIAAGLINLIIMPSGLAQGRLDTPFFFRDGQQLMDQEIQRLQQQQDNPPQGIENPSPLLTIQEGQLQWQKFIFRPAGFSIWMPEGIQSQEVEVIDTSMGKISFEVFATHPQNLRFIAAYSDPLSANQLNNIQGVLSAVQAGIVAKTNYQLVNQQAISLNGFSGQQFTVQQENNTITFRTYIVNQRIYVLGVSQKNGQTIAQEALIGFFDSFQLL